MLNCGEALRPSGSSGIFAQGHQICLNYHETFVPIPLPHRTAAPPDRPFRTQEQRQAREWSAAF